MNNDVEVSIAPEIVERLETVAGQLTSIENSQSYTSAMLAMSQYQKDNFEMIDRSLSMMQAVHKAELQNSGFYMGVLKLLIPIFATATITGAALDTPGINSLALVVVGGSGLLVAFIILVPLLIQRHKKAKRQSTEYAKLSEAFTKWEKIADLRKQLDEKQEIGLEKAQEIFSELADLSNTIDEGKK